jgi:hypothetical protein
MVQLCRSAISSSRWLSAGCTKLASQRPAIRLSIAIDQVDASLRGRGKVTISIDASLARQCKRRRISTWKTSTPFLLGSNCMVAMRNVRRVRRAPKLQWIEIGQPSPQSDQRLIEFGAGTLRRPSPHRLPPPSKSSQLGSTSTALPIAMLSCED